MSCELQLLPVSASCVYSKTYRRFVLGVLTSVYLLNVLDRTLMGLLLQPIKEDLHLSDTQLGFLTGMAFGLFYAILGLPIARWADRGNRVTIAAAAIALWSLAVMASLRIMSFTQLVCTRIFAAVGEAGGMPPTYSLVGEYFPAPIERTRAMTVYLLAGPASSFFSFVVGGQLHERFGWRMTFFLMGLPALAAAVLLKLTVAEPRSARNMSAHPAGPAGAARPASAASPASPTGAASPATPSVPRLTRVLATLWRQHTLRHLTFAFVLLSTLGLGMAPWYAAFLMRSHGLQTAELGVSLGLIFGLGGALGMGLGGYVSVRYLGENEPAQLRLSALMTAALVPCFVLFLLLPHPQQSLGALALLVAVFSFYAGPTFTLMQRLVTDDMRATTLALIMFFANLIGMGVGPQAVGILSDELAPEFGTGSLRYAMLSLSGIAVWSAYHFWRAASTAKADLSALHGRP